MNENKMNSTNFNCYNVSSKSTNFIPSHEIKLTIDIIFHIDSLIRILSFLVHSIYFVLIFKLKIMRTKACLYTHHANLIGFLFNFHYIIYWSQTYPNTPIPIINHILCSISEEIWAILKTLRTYSIALISLYRLLAIFKMTLYQKINQNYFNLTIPLIIMYLWVIIFSTANKYIFATTYGSLYCFDGYSDIFYNSLFYFLVQTILGIIFPTLFAVIAFFIIHKELDLKLIIPKSSN